MQPKQFQEANVVFGKDHQNINLCRFIELKMVK